MDPNLKQKIVGDALLSAQEMQATDDLKLRLLRTDFAFLERLTVLYEQDSAYSQKRVEQLQAVLEAVKRGEL